MTTRLTPPGRITVDAAKGLACILLVTHHAILRLVSYGNLAAGSWLDQANAWLADIRMPLFTFLSGLVYALRPVRPGSGRGFVRGKVLRLLVPLFFAATLLFTARRVLPFADASGDTGGLLRALFFSYTHFWYLQALFLVFMLVAVVEARTDLDRRSRFAALVLFSVSMYALSPAVIAATSFFSAGKAMYLLPFFVAGMGFTRFWRYVTPATLAAVAALLALAVLAKELSSAPGQWLSLAIGPSFAALLLASRLRSPFLQKIGAYSYTIFLYHTFAITGGRLLMSRLGIRNGYLQLAAMLAAGLVLPIVATRVLARFPLLSRPLLGVRYRARPGFATLPAFAQRPLATLPQARSIARREPALRRYGPWPHARSTVRRGGEGPLRHARIR